VLARRARRELRGINFAALFALRDVRGGKLRSCAARLNSNVGLNSNGVRGAVAANRH
jgi:hypothetical protein